MSPREKLMSEIDELLNKAFKKEEVVEKTEEKVEKSLDEVSDSKASGTDVTIQANGGGDVIKNKDLKDKDVEKVSKTKDCSEEDDEEDEDDEDSEDEKKGKKMKKSLEVSQEDFEILQKAKADLKQKQEQEAAQSDPLIKSISSLTEMVKSQSDSLQKMTDEIEALKKSPARNPKSLAGYRVIEKSEGAKAETKQLMKSQVLDTLWELQKSGKVQDIHVCEYEATGNIQDAAVKMVLKAELEKQNG